VISTLSVYIPIQLANSSPKYANFLLPLYFIEFALLVVAFGLFWLIWKPRNLGTKKAEKFNYRGASDEDSCIKCKCFDMKSFDGFEAECKFFHIKIDKDHVCDIIEPQLDEVKQKSHKDLD
jgi:hypothetical protein